MSGAFGSGCAHHAAGNVGADIVQVVFERRGNAEISATAANGPEEIAMFIGAGAHHAPIGQHELCRTQIVERESVLRHQPSEAAAKREPRDACRSDDAAGRRQAMDLRLAIQFLPQHATLPTRRFRLSVDVDAFHRQKVDEEPLVDRRASGDVVSAAPHGDLEVQQPRHFHGIDDIGNAVAAGDRGRVFVDQAVVHQAAHFVFPIGRLQ